MRIIAALLLVIGTTTTALAQGNCPGNELSDLAAGSGGQPVIRHIKSDLPSLSLDQLLDNSIVVLEGHVAPLRSYLSPDGCNVLTDYEVTPAAWFVAPPQRSAAPGAGVAQRIVLTLVGGSVEINGTPVSVMNDNMASLPDGGSMMLFLQRSRSDGTKFELARGVYGAFEVKAGGTLNPLLRAPGVYPAGFPEDREKLVAEIQRRRPGGGRW